MLADIGVIIGFRSCRIVFGEVTNDFDAIEIFVTGINSLIAIVTSLSGISASIQWILHSAVPASSNMTPDAESLCLILFFTVTEISLYAGTSSGSMVGLSSTGNPTNSEDSATILTNGFVIAGRIGISNTFVNGVFTSRAFSMVANNFSVPVFVATIFLLSIICAFVSWESDGSIDHWIFLYVALSGIMSATPSRLFLYPDIPYLSVIPSIRISLTFTTSFEIMISNIFLKTFLESFLSVASIDNLMLNVP